MTTIKFILPFIFCLNAFFLSAQKLTTQVSYSTVENDKQLISYSPAEKLVIEDFKGKPEAGSDAVAITSSGFSFKAGFRRIGSVATLTITVQCTFDKHHSWMKENGKTDYVLKHEQHHFDISYLGALDFIKRLRQIKFTVKNYNERLNTAYQASIDKMEALQHMYDGETHNGIAKEEQQKWNQKIDNELRLVSAR